MSAVPITAKATVRVASDRRFRLVALLTRVLLLLAFLALLEWLARRGSIAKFVMPPPSDIAKHVWTVVQGSEFRSDLVRTGTELAVSVLAALAVGLPLGMLMAKVPLVGGTLEPFLVTLYAVPFLVFYPLMLVYLGLNAGPVILIAALVAVVPITLNTMVALRELSPVYAKVGRSLSCSRWQLYRKILLPASVPLIIPGIQLGVTVALTAVIAMEFLLATKGLGFRISFDYQNYDILGVWAGIVIVVVLATLMVSGLRLIGERIRRDLD